MTIQQDLANICKDLKLLGDSQLTAKALCAYATVTGAESPQVDLSYSYVMRKLRKGEDDTRLKFQKAFKKAFDTALYEDLEDPESIALMSALKEINWKE